MYEEEIQDVVGPVEAVRGGGHPSRARAHMGEAWFRRVPKPILQAIIKH